MHMCRAARVNSAAWAVEGRAAARGYVASHAFGQSKLGVIFMARYGIGKYEHEGHA